ncbi:MAG TPA: hypothetical protein VKH81_05855 [Candidatus Angelobacter sp.]|nr:hypothetical protein [Candidatus Angelobacter sp.]
MTKQDNNRVLVRVGARELTRDEIEYVSAGQAFHTNVCTAVLATATHTGGDGDGCSDTDSDTHFV